MFVGGKNSGTSVSLTFRLAANTRICVRMWGFPAIEAIASMCPDGEVERNLDAALEQKVLQSEQAAV